MQLVEMHLLQCVAVCWCCSVLQCVAANSKAFLRLYAVGGNEFVAACCSVLVLQCVAVCCSHLKGILEVIRGWKRVLGQQNIDVVHDQDAHQQLQPRPRANMVKFSARNAEQTRRFGKIISHP